MITLLFLDIIPFVIIIIITVVRFIFIVKLNAM